MGVTSGNLRDFPKGCKCSSDVIGCDLRAQISHKNMKVICRRMTCNTCNYISENLTWKNNHDIHNTKELTGCVFLLTARSGRPIYLDFLLIKYTNWRHYLWKLDILGAMLHNKPQTTLILLYLSNETMPQDIPFPKSSFHSWRPKQLRRLCVQRTPQSNTDHC